MAKPQDLLPPTLNGNTIMLNFMDRHTVNSFITLATLDQFSVRKLDNDTFLLSTPVTEAFEEKYIGMVHGARGRAKKDDGGPKGKPPTGGGDGTPPGGGTPGTPVLDTYIRTEARAA